MIIDASALLALLHNEPGADSVRRMMPDLILSTVNLCEVVGKYAKKTGAPVEDIRSLISAVTSEIITFDER